MGSPMRRLWYAWLLVLTVSPSASFALQVAAGCDAPPAIEHGQEFFVDPARGSRENDGSAQRPWRTLAEVLDPANHLIATRTYGRTAVGLGPAAPINPAGRIKPGDTIVLMSGDHGDVDVRQYVNSEFISVIAGNGQTPVVRSLHLIASSHWLFRGIKFEGVRPEKGKGGTLVTLESHNWLGPSDNIVLVDNSFSTQGDSGEWRPEDWVSRPLGVGFASAARCTALIGNHFFNLVNAVMITGDASLIEGNRIEKMGNDGIDIVASDLVVRRNRIENGRHTPGQPLHADGIQGWTLHGATNRNVVIDSNWIVNVSEDTDNYLQGITIFDGEWDGLTVTNNLVITNTWHGISLYGVSDALVANNTVIPSRAGGTSWLMIHDSKAKTPSQHVVVRNNIAQEYIVAAKDLQFDHNLAQSEIDYQSEGGGSVRIRHGGVGDRNTIHPGLFHWFVDFDPAHGDFDLRPSPASPAREAGAEERAPADDILGRQRTPPIDIGAFAR